MPKFKLYLDIESRNLSITLIDIPQPWRLLSERDPEVPIEFTPGHAYFNPLLKKRDATQLFLAQLYLNSVELIGVNSGKPPVKGQTKVENTQMQRGWFELPPQLLTWGEIPNALQNRIYQIPKMIPVLSQLLRTQLGLKVPAGTKFETGDQWRDWICTQRLVFTPAIKQAFERINLYPDRLGFPPRIKAMMQTGVEPAPVFKVRIRWCELKEQKLIQRKLYESSEWEIEATKEQLDAGPEAILALAEEVYGKSWNTVSSYPTGEDELKTTETITTSGPIIHVQPENEANTLWKKFPEPLPLSAYSILTNEIDEQENPIRS
jgi:hypothetical protein